jgi:hypothetical protein
VRAFKVAMTAPYAPVVPMADAELSEVPIEGRIDLTIPKLSFATPPAGDSAAIWAKASLDASYAWDASPISVAHLCSELWAPD